MRIKSIINNNVVMSEDENGDENVLVGRGLGFKAKIGDPIPPEAVQKRFLLANKGVMAKFRRILDEVSSDELLVTSEIISMAKRELETPLNESIYISLTDHIHYVIERYHQGQLIGNSFLWDIQRYYPREYRVAKKAVALLNERFALTLPDDEAGFITFHLINAANNLDSTANTAAITKIVHAIIQVTSVSLKMVIDPADINSYRFITHVKFFAQRLVQKLQQNDASEHDLYLLVRDKYKTAYEVVQRIDQLLRTQYQYQMSENDELYFMMHVHRLQEQSQN